MEQNLFRLIYRSRTVVDREGIATSIHELSQREDAAQELTGVLFHDDREIVQVLEGPLAKIEQAYDAISCNLGHEDLRIVEFVPATHRLFDAQPIAMVGAREDRGARFLELIKSAGEDLGTANGQQLADLLNRSLADQAAAA